MASWQTDDKVTSSLGIAISGIHERPGSESWDWCNTVGFLTFSVAFSILVSRSENFNLLKVFPFTAIPSQTDLLELLPLVVWQSLDGGVVGLLVSAAD